MCVTVCNCVCVCAVFVFKAIHWKSLKDTHMCRHSDPVADSVWLLLKRPIPLQKEEMRGKRAARSCQTSPPPSPSTLSHHIWIKMWETLCSKKRLKCVLSGAKGSYDSEVMCRFRPRWHLMFAEQCWKKRKTERIWGGKLKIQIYLHLLRESLFIYLPRYSQDDQKVSLRWLEITRFFFWSLEKSTIQLL